MLYELGNKRIAGKDGCRIEGETGNRDGRRIVLAGSCSVMTQKQVNRWIRSGRESVQIPLKSIITGKQSIRSFVDTIHKTWPDDILIYSPGSIGKAVPPLNTGKESEYLEKNIGQLVQLLLEHEKVTRLIIAGGETSGAVIKELGWSAFHIGASAAPGVPILYPLERPYMRIVLKSGNFGGEDFFLRTLE